jgi:putative NADH-flavin reductase
MKILILGSTGRLGQQLVNEALKRGHDIHVLVRDENKVLAHLGNVTVFEGLPTDKAVLEKAMKTCDVILSALNISRTSDFPFAPLRTPKDFLSKTAENIIELMPKTNVKHAIIVTAQGVNETKKDIPFWFRWIIDNTNVKYPYLDHEKQEDLFSQSKVNWTIIRPVGLTNVMQSKAIQVSQNNTPKPTLMISRFDTAKFMLDESENLRYFGKMVTISNRK